MKITFLTRFVMLAALLASLSGCAAFGTSTAPTQANSPSLIPQSLSAETYVIFSGALLRFSDPSADLDSRLQLSASALADSPEMTLDEATRFVGGDSVYSKVHRFQLTSTTLEPGRVELLDIGFSPTATRAPVKAKIQVQIETTINANHAGKPVVAHVNVDHFTEGGVMGVEKASAENWQEMAAGDFQILSWRNTGDLYVLALRLKQAG